MTETLCSNSDQDGLMSAVFCVVLVHIGRGLLKAHAPL
jgi:hypothetical protein